MRSHSLQNHHASKPSPPRSVSEVPLPFARSGDLNHCCSSSVPRMPLPPFRNSMRRHVRFERLSASIAGRIRTLHSVSPARSAMSPAYVWSNLFRVLSTCSYQSHSPHSQHIPNSPATSSAASRQPAQHRYHIAHSIARDRLDLIRALPRESNTLRVLGLTDKYRNLIAALPRRDAMIDIDVDADSLNHWCMSPYAMPLDYCMLVWHLLRVGQMERAAAMINEMGVLHLSIRAPIRALFAHHLVLAGRHDKARQLLAPNVGDPARPFMLDKPNLGAEIRQTQVLPPAIAILLMSPNDSPFFRSNLFQPYPRKKKLDRKRKLKRKAEAQSTAPSSYVTSWENVLQCFDFLHTGGYLEPHADSYHHVMQRLAEVGQAAQCRRVFVAMRKDGVAPSTESYAILMRTLIREQLGPVPLNDLIVDKLKGHDRIQQETEAEQAKTAAKSRERQVLKLQLLTLHYEMVQKHVAVSQAVYSLLVQACCLVDDEKRAWQLYDDMGAQKGSRCELSILLALLALPSLTPRRLRELQSAALSSDTSAALSSDTRLFFIQSAIRRHSRAEVIRFLDEAKTLVWKQSSESKVAANNDSAPSLAAMYSSAMRGCNEAEMYDVTSQLFAQMREADLPTNNEHHHAFVQALCRTGCVSLALAHLEQMPASFDVLPSLADYCLVMTTAVDMPPSEERSRLLTATARSNSFGSLIFSLHTNKQQYVHLQDYRDPDALTAVRCLLLWMDWVDDEQFHERLEEAARDRRRVVRVMASLEQMSSGLCATVKAMVDESVSAATADSLQWRMSASGQWVLDLPKAAAKEVRDRFEQQRASLTADGRGQSQAEPSGLGKQAETVERTDKDAPANSTTELHTVSTSHLSPREQHAS